MEGEALAENRESLDDGAHYTIVALPSDKDGKRNLRVLKDDLEAVPPDKTRIRFVNGVPADEDVDLLIRGREDPLFDGVRFGTEAGWTELEPIVGTLVVRLDDRKSTLASLPDAKLSGGRSYTFVLAGRPGVQYELVKIEDVVGK
jgi:hypothetical protein